MQCHYFDAATCGSCTLMGTPYTDQLAGKELHARTVLGDSDGLTWLPAVAGPEQGFRNKAKMVVGGTAGDPTLGILDVQGRGVDLRTCGLYPPGITAALPLLAAFVTLADVAPYDLGSRTGELKHLLVTGSPDGELMVRFVLRSQEPVARLRKHLPWLLASLPSLGVVSVNLLPEHKAVLEGECEILLSERTTLGMRLNGITMHLRPQGFFQTNTQVAAALYRTAAAWVDELGPGDVWDLYCGVGGFALHCARPGRSVTGIETSVQAVAGAERAAQEAGLADVRFAAGDATAFALGHTGPPPDLVVVNPPRRGIGSALAGWLEASDVRHVVYSSCNVVSLASDLRAMPSLRATRAQVFDMFPQTSHYEVLTLLERAG
ncbi:MAG: rlmC [Actinotalea sp.]|nr:rlmC [Actinotalea sp.]